MSQLPFQEDCITLSKRNLKYCTRKKKNITCQFFNSNKKKIKVYIVLYNIQVKQFQRIKYLPVIHKNYMKIKVDMKVV